MAISLVNTSSGTFTSSTTSLPLPSGQQAGDLVIVSVQYISGAEPVITDSRYILAGSPQQYHRLAYRFTTENAETNIQIVSQDASSAAYIIAVYRGVQAVGAYTMASPITSLVSIPNLTLSAPNESWVVSGILIAGIATISSWSSPLVQRIQQTGTSSRLAFADTNGAVSSFTGKTVTISATSAVRVFALELIPGPTAGVITTNTTNGENGTSVALNMPSGITAGDLLLAFAVQDNPGTTNMAISGWTQVYQDAYTSNTLKLALFWKRAAGGDTATLTGEAQDYVAVVVRIAGDEVTATGDIVLSPAILDSTLNPDTNTITLNSAKGWLIFYVAGLNATATTDFLNLFVNASGQKVNGRRLAELTSAATTTSCLLSVVQDQRRIASVAGSADVWNAPPNEHITRVVGIPLSAVVTGPTSNACLFWAFP